MLLALPCDLFKFVMVFCKDFIFIIRALEQGISFEKNKQVKTRSIILQLAGVDFSATMSVLFTADMTLS